MKQYVVTISQVSEGDSTAEAKPEMIVRIDVSGGEAHVVELTVRASSGADLATGQMPSIDLERLAQVFGPETAPPARAVSAATAAAPAAPAASGAGAAGSTVRPSRRSTARPSRRQAGAATEARAGAERDITSARAYRRMPDPDELRATYSEIGSIAGVAKHYGVPSHTAQGWIGRLRRLGTSAT